MIQELSRSPWLLVGFSPFAGSFVGLLVDRLPVGRPVVIGRSACESCGRVLGVTELAPVLAYLAQGGRCRGCAAKIPWRLPATEIVCVVISIITLALAPDRAWEGALLGWGLLALAVIDARAGTLPDPLTLGLLLLGLGTAAWAYRAPPVDETIGAIAGLTIFGLIAALYPRLRGRAGLGWGDVKLFGAAGAWIGWQGLAEVSLIAALTGIGWVLARRFLARVAVDEPLPFGPALALGIWVTWLIGEAS